MFITCNAQAPYCHLRPARFYSIFPHYLVNATIFGKKVNKHKCVFCFSVRRLSETFFILRRNAGDVIKNVNWSCQVLMKFDFSRQIFEKHSHIKFPENSSNRSRVVACDWTGGRTHVTKLIVAFRNSANARKKLGSKYTYRPNVLLRRTLNCTSCTIPRCSYKSIFSAHTSLSLTVSRTLYSVVTVTTTCYYILFHALLLSMFMVNL